MVSNRSQAPLLPPNNLIFVPHTLFHLFMKCNLNSSVEQTADIFFKNIMLNIAGIFFDYIAALID